MNRVLTAGLLTFTLLTQPAYAQFAPGGYGGYANQGVGYLPAMQGCPYNQGVLPGAQSPADDDAMADRLQRKIDKLEGQEACLETGDNNSDSDDSDVAECRDFQKKNNIKSLENELGKLLPSELFALAITDHMEELADCSCAPGAIYDQNAPGQKPGAPVPAAKPAVKTTAMNDTAPGNQCLQFDTPDFVGQFPSAFKTVDNSWMYAQPSDVKDLNFKALRIAKNASSLGANRAPAATASGAAPATTAPAAADPKAKAKAKVKAKARTRRLRSGNATGDPQAGATLSSGNTNADPQADDHKVSNGDPQATTPAPVVIQPVPAAAVPAAPVCAPNPLPVPSTASTCPAPYWYPGINGAAPICKDKGGIDGRICTNEFNANVVDESGRSLKHLSSDETSTCRNDLDLLYEMIKKRHELKVAIEALKKKEFAEEMGLGKKHKRHRGDDDDMESSAGGLSSATKLGLVIGAGTSLLGAGIGYFGGRASANYQCSMNAKLGYPCYGNNWGAVSAGIAGLGVGVPIMQAALYSGAQAGGAAGCGGQGVPYGMQPAYGMPGVPGANGAFGYPQGYGPLSPFGRGGFNGIGAGALNPGMGYFSQGMANPYGSPFGPNQFGGVGGQFGGQGSPFGGYGGGGYNGGFGSGATMPWGGGGGGYGGYNPAAAQGEMAYRLGYENPMGFAANAASADILLQQAQIGVAQINGGYGGYGYGAYGAGSAAGYGYQNGGGYPNYGGAGLSAGFSLSAGFGRPAYPNYNVGYGNSFNTMAPSTALSVFGTSGSSNSSGAPFGR